jgi:hypothetical protein
MAAEPPISPENSPQLPQTASPDGEGKAKAVDERTTPGVGAAPSFETPRVEVSAATITRMMGIASSNDLRLLEGRLDVLTSKVAGLVAKVERVLSMFSSLPTSSDIDRLELQVGTMKSMVRELMEDMESARKDGGESEKQLAAEQSRKIRGGIKSNQD